MRETGFDDHAKVLQKRKPVTDHGRSENWKNRKSYLKENP